MAKQVVVSEWLINTLFQYIEQVIGLLWLVCGLLIGLSANVMAPGADRNILAAFTIVFFIFGVRMLARSKYAFKKAKEEEWKRKPHD